MNFTWIHSLPPQLATLFLAMLPIGESRVAIPVALESLNLPLWQAFSFSVVGSFIPSILIIYFIEPVSNWLRKFKIWDRFFTWLFARTRRRFAKKYEVWGKIALLIFVAIPLPVTGVWTGSLAAWLFGFRKKDALLYVAGGAIVAGIIVSLVSVGAISLFNLI